MNKNILRILIVGTIILYPYKISADSLQDNMDKLKNNLNQSQKSYDYVVSEISKIESNIQKFDNDISILTTEIKKNNEDLKLKQSNCEKLKAAAEENQRKIKIYEDDISKKVKLSYMDNTDTYLDILFGSNNINDVDLNVKIVEKIISNDKLVMDEYIKEKNELINNLNTLNKEKEDIENLQKDNIEKLNKLNKLKNNEQEVIKHLQFEKNIYGNAVSKNQKDIDLIMSQISSAKNNNGNSSNISSEYLSNPIVKYGCSFLGIPYVWGGDTPSGFDCSGLVQYIYKNFGIDLPRTTYEQVNCGTEISKDNLIPGDLVFFGEKSAPHHVGLYVGNNCYLQAPQTGDVVKISSLSDRSDFCTARRVK